MATTEDPKAEVDSAGEWRRELYDAKPERQGELFSTMSGIENEPLYTPDNGAVDYERELGYPGVFPFTRGVYPSMYRGRLWTMRQFAVPNPRTGASSKAARDTSTDRRRG